MNTRYSIYFFSLFFLLTSNIFSQSIVQNAINLAMLKENYSLDELILKLSQNTVAVSEVGNRIKQEILDIEKEIDMLQEQKNEKAEQKLQQKLEGEITDKENKKSSLEKDLESANKRLEEIQNAFGIYFTPLNENQKKNLNLLNDFLKNPFLEKNSLQNFDIEDLLDLLKNKSEEYNEALVKLQKDVKELKEKKINGITIQPKEKQQIKNASLINFTKEESSTSQSETKSTPTVSNNLETRIIDATAQFIVERIKDDVIVLALRELNKHLQNVALLRKLFPVTLDLISNLRDLEMTQYLKQLKASFAEDVKQMPMHCLEYLETFPGLQQNEKVVFDYLNILIPVVQNGIKGYHPYELIDLSDQQFQSNDKINSNFKEAFHIINSLQKELVSNKDGGNFWEGSINFSELKKIDAKEYFLALLLNNSSLQIELSKIKNKFGINQNNIDEKKFEEEFKNFKSQIEKLSACINRMDNSLKQISMSGNINPESIILYTNTITEFTENSLEIAASIGMEVDNVTKTTKDVKEITKSVSLIYSSVLKSDYLTLLNGLISLLNKFNIQFDERELNFVKDQMNFLYKLKSVVWDSDLKRWEYPDLAVKNIERLLEDPEITEDKNFKNYTYILTDIKNEIYLKYKNTRFDEMTLKQIFLNKINEYLDKNKQLLTSNSGFTVAFEYLTKILSIANAKSSLEMKEVIYSFAEKPGSYLRKRTDEFNISLNSYPGLFGSCEWLGEICSFKESKRNLGITIPIGFDVSVLSGGLRFFLQALDIGAVLNYRFTNNEQEQLPDNIKLDQLFSPGIGIFYAPFPEYPFTIGPSLTLTPKLRKINASGIETVDKKSLRFGISINYDLPIVILF